MTEPGVVADLYAESGVYVAVENVPADVCRQCGERYYSPGTTKRLLSLTEEARRGAVAGSPAQVLVFDFGREAALAAVSA